MMIATVLAVLAAAPEISLAGDRVCASGEVKLRVGPTITTIESPFANASMKIDPLATPEVSVGRAKPGVFLVAGLTDGGASAHLSILALPDGGDCLSLSVAKTQSTKIDEAQRPSWEKFLAGYRGMNAADREKVSVALRKSLGTTAPPPVASSPCRPGRPATRTPSPGRWRTVPNAPPAAPFPRSPPAGGARLWRARWLWLPECSCGAAWRAWSTLAPRSSRTT